jgi:hypothetical protein
MVGWDVDIDVLAILSPGDLIVRTQVDSMEERWKLKQPQYSEADIENEEVLTQVWCVPLETRHKCRTVEESQKESTKARSSSGRRTMIFGFDTIAKTSTPKQALQRIFKFRAAKEESSSVAWAEVCP